jgi:hypothetical protein
MTTADQQLEIARLRIRLQESLNKAPDWMSGASVQRVRDWKSAYAKAKKLLDKNSATAGELYSAIQSVS